MCGIVGAVANRDVVPFLVDGLKRLEYRGYDSAGVAVLSDELRRVRRTGRVVEMETAAQEENLHGFVGIGHTRWATHGGVTEGNAHPHISSGELALVHNGIIENHEQLRERLRNKGYVFESQTDTEVIGHLIHHFLKIEKDLLQATQCAVKELQGAYAIAVISKHDPQRLVAARMGCPLLVGLGEGENFIASDASAVISATRNIIFLEESEKHPFATKFKELLLHIFSIRKKLVLNTTPYKIDDVEAIKLGKQINDLLIMSIDKEKHPNTLTFQLSMLKYRTALTPCLYNLDIPPDNNGSERAIRNIKVKQKVSGQFKSGQNAFCVIRSVIDTLRKRGVEVLPCLNQIIKLQPV